MNRRTDGDGRRFHAYRCPFTEHEHAAAIRFARYPDAHPKGRVA